jgi:hypothetical protein
VGIQVLLAYNDGTGKYPLVADAFALDHFPAGYPLGDVAGSVETCAGAGKDQGGISVHRVSGVVEVDRVKIYPVRFKDGSFGFDEAFLAKHPETVASLKQRIAEVRGLRPDLSVKPFLASTVKCLTYPCP